MIASDLADFLSAALRIKPGTVFDRIKANRAAGLIAKGKQGPSRGAQMNEADAINALLACVLDHSRGDDVAANVRRARAQPGYVMVTPPADFLRSASFTEAKTAGEALDALFADVRRGRLNRDLRFDINIESRGAWLGLSVGVPVEHLGHGIAQGYFITGEKMIGVERQTNIRESVIVRLVEALGPPVAA